MDTPDTATPDTSSQKVLCLSDLHIGAPVSRYPKYKEYIHRLMDQADHVVLNGDIFEMFYLEKPGGVKSADVVRKASKDARDWLEKELEKKPGRHIHFVLGNHENLKRFRKRLDRLKEKHGNFHWHTEGIAIGNMLFVHGDLQERGQTDATRKTYRVSEASSRIDRDTGILNWFYEPGHAYKIAFGHGKKKDSRRISAHLENCADYASTCHAEYEQLCEIEQTDDLRDKERKKLEEMKDNILHFQRFGSPEPEVLTREAYDQFAYIGAEVAKV